MFLIPTISLFRPYGCSLGPRFTLGFTPITRQLQNWKSLNYILWWNLIRARILCNHQAFRAPVPQHPDAYYILRFWRERWVLMFLGSVINIYLNLWFVKGGKQQNARDSRQCSLSSDKWLVQWCLMADPTRLFKIEWLFTEIEQVLELQNMKLILMREWVAWTQVFLY